MRMSDPGADARHFGVGNADSTAYSLIPEKLEEVCLLPFWEPAGGLNAEPEVLRGKGPH